MTVFILFEVASKVNTINTPLSVNSYSATYQDFQSDAEVIDQSSIESLVLFIKLYNSVPLPKSLVCSTSVLTILDEAE